MPRAIVSLVSLSDSAIAFIQPHRVRISVLNFLAVPPHASEQVIRTEAASVKLDGRKYWF